MNLVDKILQSVTGLSPFPVVMDRVIQIINDPKSSAQDVVDVIQYDQSITASVLKVCNSSYFGLRRTVHSLREALVIIGFNQLLEIILGQGSSNLLARPCKGYNLQAGALWQHSVGCALLSRIIKKRLRKEASFAHFTAALVHDIGKVTLGQFVQDYLEDIKKLVRHEHLTFTEAEKKVLGIDHAELGEKIAEQWNFPENIVYAVRYHHTPSLTTDHHDIVQTVYISDLITMVAGIGGGADDLSYQQCKEVLNQYNLKEKDIDEILVHLKDRFELVQEVVGGEPLPEIGLDASAGVA